MLELKFTRVEPVVNSSTNNVEAFIIGATGTDTETLLSAYIDIKKDVSTLKPLENWTNDEIRQFCIDTAVEQNWYVVLAQRIDYLNNQPIIGQNIDSI